MPARPCFAQRPRHARPSSWRFSFRSRCLRARRPNPVMVSSRSCLYQWDQHFLGRVDAVTISDPWAGPFGSNSQIGRNQSLLKGRVKTVMVYPRRGFGCGGEMVIMSLRKGVDLATPLGYVERNYQRCRGVNRDQ
jgi:hypothetical protein